VRELKRRGVSVVFISHALEESVADLRPHHVLRDGRMSSPTTRDNFDRARIIQAMVGRDLSKTLYAERKTTCGPPARAC
jgi:simple sugar transport system ATP-binding protein